jgi:hypothetical protein
MFRNSVVLLILGAVFSTNVYALPVTGPINLDSYAMSGWKNATHYSGSNSSGSQYASIDVAYAVYQTSNFVASGAFDPSNGGDSYVYAYQLFNVGTSNVNVNNLVINLIASSTVGVLTTDGYIGRTGGVVPLSKSAAEWDFCYQSFSPDKHSVVLLFTSDYAPTMGTASFRAGDISGTFNVPVPFSTPTPEPVTIGLLGLGFAGLLRRKK